MGPQKNLLRAVPGRDVAPVALPARLPVFKRLAMWIFIQTLLM